MLPKKMLHSILDNRTDLVHGHPYSHNDTATKLLSFLLELRTDTKAMEQNIMLDSAQNKSIGA